MQYHLLKLALQLIWEIHSDTSIPFFCGQRTIHCLLNSCHSPRPDFPTIITLSLEFIEVQASNCLLGTLHLCMKHLIPLMQQINNHLCTSTTSVLRSQPVESIRPTANRWVCTGYGVGHNFRFRGYLPHPNYFRKQRFRFLCCRECAGPSKSQVITHSSFGDGTLSYGDRNGKKLN